MPVRSEISNRAFRERIAQAWAGEKLHGDARSSPAAFGVQAIQTAASEQETTSGSADMQLRRTWMKYERAQRMVGGSKVLRRLTIGVFARLELLLLRGHKDRTTLSRIRRCRRGAESLLTGNEAFFLYSLARAQRALEGAMAELGVFQGSSAQIICEAKKDCLLYLFDTFSGLPEPNEIESRFLRRGQFSASLPAVQGLLEAYANVRFHPGIFPQSAKGMDGVRFSLVHLDADLYSSTVAGLEFFYPRMVPGGIIITHDYSTLPGVARAFAEFLKEKPETVIELPTTQAMIVVRGPRPIRSSVDARLRSATV
jgi:O-methyltransferase